MMLDILDYDPVELESKLTADFGLERFRARQLRAWLYRRHVADFDAMSDIAKPARRVLSSNFRIFRPRIADLQVSRDGTRKFLFEMERGALVETVLIAQVGRDTMRGTLCVSSQVGCAMGCSFCRTATMGLKRNLAVHEIIGQILAVKDYIERESSHVFDFSNIVFMGMGEPFHNYDNVVKAISILNDDLGLAYSSRKITVSTSGIVPAIRRFEEDGVGANIAISLNATTDEVRSQIMPVNRKWPIATLLATIRDIQAGRSLTASGRNKHITIEYVMLGGVNDSDSDLKRLPRLLHGIPVKLNLIPYNENSGLGYKAVDPDRVINWQRALCASGLNTRVRWSKGEDINAACGQLAALAQISGSNISGEISLENVGVEN